MSSKSDDQINYEHIARNAMRAVPKDAMAYAERNGCLPGDHHFVLTFSTTHPGVDISRILKKRFANEMTIVIQHQYADLHVCDNAFDVVLKFDGRPEALHVPFAAITRFSDPSVPFLINFGPPETPPRKTTDASSPPPDKQKPQQDPGNVVVSLDAFRNNS